MGERFSGSSISGSAVARSQLLVDWARLVRTATGRVEGAKRVAVRYGPFCGSCRRLGGLAVAAVFKFVAGVFTGGR
jgi:hypothetical protein